MVTLPTKETSVVYIDLSLLANADALAASFAAWVAKRYSLAKADVGPFVARMNERRIFFLPRREMFTEIHAALVQAGAKGVARDLSWDNLADLDQSRVTRATGEWDLDLQEVLVPGGAEFLAAAAKASPGDFNLVSRLREDAVFRFGIHVTTLLGEQHIQEICKSCSAYDTFYIGRPAFTAVTINADNSSFWAKRMVALNTNLARTILFTSSQKWALAALTAGVKSVVLVGTEQRTVASGLEAMLKCAYFDGMLADGWQLHYAESLAQIEFEG